MPRLDHIEQVTDLPSRKPKPLRYEMTRPGELVHVDIKKLGRTFDNKNNKKEGRGYSFLHHAVDDYSRLAYSEILADERKETVAAFWERARTFFAAAGVTVTGVMTDNGSCYRSGLFKESLGKHVTHRFTRPYRPQTNGKVERFNRTLAEDWAYADIYGTDEARAATYGAWLHHYNHHRPHTGIGGLTPSDRVHNFTGNYNGTRPRTLSTTAGDLQLRNPKLRAGSFFPWLLERRRRVDQALFAVVMEAYVHGVSTRKIDDLVRALGADSGISKSEVSRICQDLDEDVAEFRKRRLDDTTYPYVFVDATYCKARLGRRAESQAIVIAIGVATDGSRQVLGFQVGDTESEPFWTEFFRDLKARGLSGVQLVISDAHAGLMCAIEVAFQGSACQRCRVHFMRNVLVRVPKVASQMVAAIIRTIFVPPGKRELVHAQFGEVVTMLERSHPAAAEFLEDSKDDLLAFTEFLSQHWQKSWSTSPLERLNKEIK